MNERKKRDISIKVGEIYASNKYGEVSVIEVSSYKNILVKFTNTGNEQFVSGSSLLSGEIVDKKLFNETKLIFVGKIFDTKSYGKVVVEEIVDADYSTVKFLNTDNKRTVSNGNLRRGLIKDIDLFKDNCPYSVGTVHSTNNSGDVIVVDVINSHNLRIKFLNTGNEKTVSAGNLKKGTPLDTKYFEENYEYKVGAKFNSNNYGYFEILEFCDNGKVKIRFENTGYDYFTTISQISCGAVKDPSSTIFHPKALPENRFCVYLHKDSSGVVRYVGQGLVKRAIAKTGRNSKWRSIFKDKEPIVEIVKSDISKEEAEDLEQELIEKYNETIVNSVRTYSRGREMLYEDFVEFFEISEESPSGLVWRKDYLKNKSGDIASDSVIKGYHRVYMNRETFLVHRIVWLLKYGSIDKFLVIDHKNLNRSDNRISNLSLVSMSENMRNRILPLPNSGYRNIAMDISNTGIIRFTVNYTKPLHDKRDKLSFSTVNYSSAIEAFNAAYLFRDSLIEAGILNSIIKTDEKPLEQMYKQLADIGKEN